MNPAFSVVSKLLSPAQFSQREDQYIQSLKKRSTLDNAIKDLTRFAHATKITFSDGGGERKIHALGLAVAPQFPKLNIIGSVDRSYWSLHEKQAFRKENRQSWAISNDPKPYHLQCTLASNSPDLDDRYDQVYDIIRHFKIIIGEAANCLDIDLEKVQWRYNIRHCNKPSIDKVIASLTARGFVVTIGQPYCTLEPYEGAMEIYDRQDLIVSIPKGAGLPDGAGFKAFPGYKSELTLNNLLVLRKDVKNPSTLFKSEPLPMEQVVSDLNSQLELIAEKSPLTRRFGFKLPCLSLEAQEELRGRLETLGYPSTLEAPQVSQQFVGLLNGCYQIYMNQYLMITLPEEK